MTPALMLINKKKKAQKTPQHISWLFPLLYATNNKENKWFKMFGYGTKTFSGNTKCSFPKAANAENLEAHLNWTIGL